MTHVFSHATPDAIARGKTETARSWLNPRHHPFAAWAVLAVSLVVTAIAWHIADNFVTRSTMDRFRFETDDIRAAVAKRMQDQEVVLRGGVGLFAASDDVTRQEWAVFVDLLDIDLYFPGLQGFGFSLQVRPEDLNAHIDDLRAEGFADYTIRPDGRREVYTSIVFLEPFDWRNQRAFGFDMFSEPTRRAAMERARDSGRPAVSGAVTLVQETETDVQRGFLMYLPVYRSGEPTDTVDQRRQALLGYVYSPFRMDDLMRGLLGAGHRNISFEIFDGTDISADNRLYTSHPSDTHDAAEKMSLFQRSDILTTGGRQWLLKFAADPGYVSGAERNQPLFIVAGGLLIDLLLFMVIGAIARQRQRAMAFAEIMTLELRDQTSRTQAIVDTILDGVITTDEDGTIGSCNPASTSMFGYAPDELVGRNVTMLIPDPNGYLSDYLRGREAAAIANDREVSGRRKNGSTFPMDLSVSPMTINGKKMFTTVVRDISERKRNEKLKNDFVAVVSHELRTPLTSLIGSLALVRTGALGSIPEKAANFISIAHRNGERLAVLVNDILNIEKIEAGHMSFRFNRTEIVSLIRQTLAECHSYAVKFNVSIRYEDQLDEAYVQADSARMVQVMSNLVSNAAKFSPEEAEIRVCVSRVGEMIRISVSDQGPGIQAELHDHVFEKFSQIDTSDSRHQDGSGLGLSISQAIIEEHGSQIHLISEMGKGATFFFDLTEVPAENSGDDTVRGPADLERLAG